MFKHIKEIFQKKAKTLPKMTCLQRMLVTCSQVVIGRKSRKHYLRSHDGVGIPFENPKVMEALFKLQN